jgi:hypothetical protein
VRNLECGWRKQHNEKLHDFYCLRSIFRMIKSGRMRLAEHVTRIGVGEKKKNAYRLLVGKTRGKVTIRKTMMEVGG